VNAAALVAVTVAIWSLPAAASASVFAGHSGWFWGNPVPQGNTLRAVEFSGNRGYAVGDFGTVMRSDDGGASWTGITSGTTAALRLVDAISPDTIVVGGECVVRRSDDAGKSFVALPWTPPGSACHAPVRSLAFPTSDIGYLLLFDGTVLRTRDEGQTWVRRTAIPGTAATNPESAVHPTDVQFPGPDMGVVATEAGVLYRTTDGGISWSPVAAATQHLDSISFPDPLTGYAVGGASVLKTDDGGITWNQRGIVLPPKSLAWIRCADALKCVSATARGDELLRTDDGGSTWTAISPSTRALFASTYSASGSVVAVGEAGATVASSDGGHNFSSVGGELAGAFTRLRASSPLVAYALGQAGTLARTIDGGKGWSPLAPPAAGELLDVSFPTTDRGYALDRQGAVMRTDDGGASWHLLDIGTYLRPRAVLALDTGHVLLVGPRGLRRSETAGANFARVRDRTVATSKLRAAGKAGRLVFAFGPLRLVVSLDGGQTWQAANLPRPGKALVKADFVTESVAYALTRDGRLWKTVNRGGSWRELPALGSEVGTDLAFSDLNNGYVAVSQFGDNSYGYVMRTSDGGLTWRPQLIDRARIRPGALAAPGAQAGFAISGTNHLLATENGGDVGERSQISLSVRRRRPGRPGVIALSGTLTPALGGETVVVSERKGQERHWLFRYVTVSASGRFTVFANVTKTTRFVAQWSGDDTRAGAGSALLTVRIGTEFAKPVTVGP
jgi:photosystem II stability/assembly factor-like uncharacterized protein